MGSIDTRRKRRWLELVKWIYLQSHHGIISIPQSWNEKMTLRQSRRHGLISETLDYRLIFTNKNIFLKFRVICSIHCLQHYAVFYMKIILMTKLRNTLRLLSSKITRHEIARAYIFSVLRTTYKWSEQKVSLSSSCCIFW